MSWLGRIRNKQVRFWFGLICYLELANSKSFPVAEKMMRATSASQRTDSSSAFLSSPLLLLENVTCLAVMLSIFLILIFSLAILRILSPKKKISGKLKALFFKFPFLSFFFNRQEDIIELDKGYIEKRPSINITLVKFPFLATDVQHGKANKSKKTH